MAYAVLDIVMARPIKMVAPNFLIIPNFLEKITEKTTYIQKEKNSVE